MGGTIAWAVFNPLRPLDGLDIGEVSLSGTQVTMAGPKLTGFRRNLQPYEITATKAVQNIKDMSVIELNDLKAHFVLDDKGSIADLKAKTGVWNTKTEQMRLTNNVRLTTDKGQDVQLKSASVDFKSGRIVSKEPVTVTLPDGLIEANSMEVTENGKNIVFRGQVRSVFAADNLDSTTSQTSPSGEGPVVTSGSAAKPSVIP